MHRFIFGAALVVAFGTAIHVPGTAEASERAGQTTRVQPDSYQRESFFPSSLDVGDEIYREAEVYTEQYGSIEMRFDDGSQLTMGPNTELTIDDYVYSGSAGGDRATISLGRGMLRMVSGQIASDRVSVRTAVATVGIRGTDFTLDTATDGIVKVWVDDGTVAVTPNQAGQTFEFTAPAFAVCSASSCDPQDGGGNRPIAFPNVPEGAGSIFDQDEDRDGGGGGGGGGGGSH